MDRLDELSIFVRIVEEGSLVGAARKLRRSPPAVTRALAALEERIGLRLIDRTTRRMMPTEAGRTLLERARAVLRITAPVQFGRRHIAPIVTAFLDRFTETEVELVLADRNLDLFDEAID